MKIISLLLLVLTSLPVIAQNNGADAKNDSISYANLNPEKVSVTEYFEMLRYKSSRLPFKTITVNKIPQGWITEKDVEYLIQFIESEEKAYCINNVVSSFYPTNSSTMGGHALELIDFYRGTGKYPNFLYICPVTDASRIASVKEWWKKLKIARK